MTEQKRNEVNLKEEQNQKIRRTIAELRLLVQRLQHRLIIYEGPRAIKDDVEIVGENNPNGDDEGLDDDTLPHQMDFGCYLRVEQQERQERDMRDWYDRCDRYNG